VKRIKEEVFQIRGAFRPCQLEASQIVYYLPARQTNVQTHPLLAKQVINAALSGRSCFVVMRCVRGCRRPDLAAE
jgi:hypothetical protein